MAHSYQFWGQFCAFFDEPLVKSDQKGKISERMPKPAFAARRKMPLLRKYPEKTARIRPAFAAVFMLKIKTEAEASAFIQKKEKEKNDLRFY